MIGFEDHGQVTAILSGSLITVISIICYTVIVLKGMN